MNSAILQFSFLLLSIASFDAHAQSMLLPGASKVECGVSMLEPGLLKSCSQTPPAKQPSRAETKPAPFAKAKAPTPEKSSEKPKKRDIDAEVAEYLQNYGKPPPVAVRALLNPTDENVQALVEYNQRREALARYMAKRMTEVQMRQQQTDQAGTAKSDLLATDTAGMKIKYYFAINCTYCAAETPILQSMSVAYPQLEIEGVESSGANSFEIIEYARKAGATFAMRRAKPGEIRQLGVTATPTLFVADKASSNRSARLDGLQTQQQIAEAIKGIRNKKQ